MPFLDEFAKMFGAQTLEDVIPFLPNRQVSVMWRHQVIGGGRITGFVEHPETNSNWKIGDWVLVRLYNVARGGFNEFANYRFVRLEVNGQPLAANPSGDKFRFQLSQEQMTVVAFYTYVADDADRLTGFGGTRSVTVEYRIASTGQLLPGSSERIYFQHGVGISFDIGAGQKYNNLSRMRFSYAAIRIGSNEDRIRDIGNVVQYLHQYHQSGNGVTHILEDVPVLFLAGDVIRLNVVRDMVLVFYYD